MTRYIRLGEYFWLAEQVAGIDTSDLSAAAHIELADSALHAPQAGFESHEFYPELLDKDAVLVCRLAWNHPLPDGNKRAAWAAMALFLDLNGPTSHARKPLLRADSAFYGAATSHAAIRGGADVSITVRQDPQVRRAIAAIDENAWTPIEYTDAVFDEQAQTWVSRAEVAEIQYTAFTSKKKSEQVTGRLVVRRIPDLNPGKKDGQDTLFDSWRFHAFFTTTDQTVADTVTADKTHRAHAVIEEVHADLKGSALAHHLPSGVFTANAAWLVLAVMAFNLTRAAATLTGPGLAKATTATCRRTLIAIPARIASSARRIVLHLPRAWPWQTPWTTLFDRVSDPPPGLAT